MRKSNKRKKDPREQYSVFNELRKSMDRGIKELKNYPGVFTPFTEVSDFGFTLVAPIVSPIACALTTCLTLAGAFSYILKSSIHLLFAAGNYLFNNTDEAKDFFLESQYTAKIAFTWAIGSVAFTILTLVAAPLALAHLVTRSLATVASPIVNYCNQNNENENEFSLSH